MSATTQRADATRNREQILVAARTALADRSSEVSMAEVARRAGVGMATLYRNFAGRRELLEALYTEEVGELVAAARVPADSTSDALRAWLRRFVVFHEQKHPIAVELLQHTDRADPMFGTSRDRVLAAGRPLLTAAQEKGDARTDVTLEQVLDLLLAVASVPGDHDYIEPILETVLDGLRA